jgi:hypothetical protein
MKNEYILTWHAYKEMISSGCCTMYDNLGTFSMHPASLVRGRCLREAEITRQREIGDITKTEEKKMITQLPCELKPKVTILPSCDIYKLKRAQSVDEKTEMHYVRHSDSKYIRVCLDETEYHKLTHSPETAIQTTIKTICECLLDILEIYKQGGAALTCGKTSPNDKLLCLSHNISPFIEEFNVRNIGCSYSDRLSNIFHPKLH